MQFEKFHPELVREAKRPKDPKSISKSFHKFSLFLIKAATGFINTAVASGLGKKSYALLQEAAKKDSFFAVVKHGLIDDEVMITYWNVVATFFRMAGKCYVIQKDFFIRFANMNLDRVKFRHLPEQLSGFVQLPSQIQDEDGEKFNSFYFYIGEITKLFPINDGEALKKRWEKNKGIKTNRCLSIGWIGEDNHHSAILQPIPEDPDMDVKEIFQNIKVARYEYDEANNKMKMREYGEEDGYRPNKAILINLLAYIQSGDPDLRSFKNTLRYRGHSTTKVVNADQHLSQEEVVLVGYGYKKERLKTDESWSSMPHFGWRWHGPGKKQIKLTYIKGSVKKWKKEEQ